MRVRVGGSFKEVASAKVYVSGEWKDLVCAEYYDGSAWVEIANFLPPMSLEISPSSTSGTITSGAVCTTAAVSAAPSGGQSPYTYSWALTSGVGAATAPLSATTQFQTALAPGTDALAIFTCTATDSMGVQATDTVSASFFNNSGIL